jgi:predicted ATPase
MNTSHRWRGEEDEGEDLSDGSQSSAGSSLTDLSFLYDFDSENLVMNFQQLDFCGREKERQLLSDAYTRTKQKGASPEVVLVHGLSGTGKTTLVRTLQEPAAISNGYFVQGKWDQIQQNEPFSGLVAAFSDLCDLVVQSDDFEERLDKIKEILQRSGDDKLLANLFSHPDIFGDVDTSADHAESSRTSNRLNTSFQALMTALSSPDHHIIIFLDDVQWADRYTLEVIKTIVSDETTENILFVLACRDNDPNSEKVHELASSVQNSSTILLSSLPLEDANVLVACLLAREPADTVELSTFIAQKTNANPFFMQQFFGALQSQGLISYTKASKEWHWDFDRIQNENNVSNDVVVPDTLHAHIQSLLVIASFLGNRFDRSLLLHIVKAASLSKDYETENPFLSVVSMAAAATSNELIHRIDKLLKVACSEGLIIEMVGAISQTYKFAHDKIQQAMYESISEQEQKSRLHLRIGYLIREMENCDITVGAIPAGVVFAIADHLNRGWLSLIDKESQYVDFAQVNLKAAMAAIAKSGFFSASHYVDKGMEYLSSRYLGEDSQCSDEGLGTAWMDDYPLILELSSTSCLVNSCLGNFAKSQEIARQVIANARTISDKKLAYKILIQTCPALNNPHMGVVTGLAVLREMKVLQVPASAHSGHVTDQLLRTRSLLRNMSDEDILNLPMMEDDDMLYSVSILELIATYATAIGNELLSTCGFLRIMQLSITSGISMATTPTALAWYGVVELNLGDIEKGYRFGKLALALLSKIDSKECTCRTITIAYSMVLHFKESIHDSITPHLHGIRSALANNDFEFAVYATSNYFAIAFHIGQRLTALEDYMRETCGRYRRYKQEKLRWPLPYWQAVLCLLGRSDRPTVLAGEAIPAGEVAWIEALKESKARQLLSFTLVVRLQLECLFDDFDAAENTIAELEQHPNKGFRLHFTVHSLHLYSGIALVGLARLHPSKKQTHKSKLKKLIAQLRKLEDAKCPNSRPVYYLLLAEKRGLSNKTVGGVAKLIAGYDEAITIAKEANFRQIEAIANERAGIATVVFDPERSNNYFLRAHELYSKWGAVAKVESLERKCRILFSCMDWPSARLGTTVSFAR